MNNRITLSMLFCGLILFSSCTKQIIPGMEIPVDTSSERPDHSQSDDGITANIYESNKEYKAELTETKEVQKLPSTDIDRNPKANIFRSNKDYIKEDVESIELQKLPSEFEDTTPTANVYENNKEYRNNKSFAPALSPDANTIQKEEGGYNVQGQNNPSHDKRNNRTNSDRENFES